MEENRGNLGKTEAARFFQQNQKFVNSATFLHGLNLTKPPSPLRKEGPLILPSRLGGEGLGEGQFFQV
jgi:hypothetical protein